MKIKQFFEENNLNLKIEINQSERKNYEGSKDPILYLSLERPVDGQDYLVLSHSLATKVQKDPSAIKEADAKLTEFGWGLICRAQVTTIATVEL